MHQLHVTRGHIDLISLEEKKRVYRFSTYIAPEAAYAASASAALCVTDRAGYGLWPAAIYPYVALVCLDS